MMSEVKIYYIVTIILISLLPGLGCKNKSQPDRPNIVWIIAEDISPALGCYGDAAAYTPNIDKLASTGLVYDKAYAVAPICSPSRSTLATGLYPAHLGTHPLRSETIFPGELKTMPVLFREAGYFTTLFGKTDYNFDPHGLWEYWSNDERPWSKRKVNQPFLSVFTLSQTHEGKGNSYAKYKEMVDALSESEFAVGQKREIPLPPAYPQAEEARLLWSRYYDLITMLDHKVGELLRNLEEDGLMDNTIVFFFSDHGFGMPGFKRWLTEGGLRVPLVLYVPEKYKGLMDFQPGDINQDLVSFADFVPTALGFAGIDVPDYMQGRNFANANEKRKYVFASRDRADNAFELSRAVRDERYLYIRNYLPHLPRIQKGKIFSDEKEAYAMLHQHYSEGTLPEPGIQMYKPKPVEELYDLMEDPWQLANLADLPSYQTKKSELINELQHHILSTCDLAFLPEGELNLRTGEKAPWYLTKDTAKYNTVQVFSAAQKVGVASEAEIEKMLFDSDAAVRYWGIMALRQLSNAPVSRFYEIMLRTMQDTSPSVSIASAEWLYHNFASNEALHRLMEFLEHKEVTVRLEAARAIELLPLANHHLQEIQPELTRNLLKYKSDEAASYPYTDYNYASFISWSLESLLKGSPSSF